MERCIVCQQEEWTYGMNAHGLTYFSCENCELIRLYPEPSAKTVAALTSSAKANNEMERLAARERAASYWRYLQKRLGPGAKTKRILLTGSDPGSLAQVGRERGFLQVEIENASESVHASRPASFDACMCVFGLERRLNPGGTLEYIWQALNATGQLLVVMPLMDSLPARLCAAAWTELRPENRFFFNRTNIQSMLLHHGFNKIWITSDWRYYTLEHVNYRARTYPATRLTSAINAMTRLVPRALMKRMRILLPSSAALVSASKTQICDRKKLTIVMPAYNEVKTFAECFNAVVGKQLDRVEKEVIVVESNSSDGTRELALQLCQETATPLILQDRAAGKGNAVREGLAAATGDIILIQDADLEYDVNDYDALLRPILQDKTAFVLGSRHSGSWKLRKFNDQPAVALFFNLGHVLFRASLNLLLRQSLKDPFTMYKVFRTDCLHGLRLESNRFDFDFEILIKLVRKGYRPLEVPVNYQARSLAEGKKVSALRDPFTWIRALVKYRLQRLDSANSLQPTTIQ
jgi:Glycosyl transferase family 2